MSHELIPIKETPKRKFTKKSIYDDVIDDFLERDDKMMKIEMTKAKDGLKLSGTYLSGRLRKRIKQRELKGIRANTVNGEAYFFREETLG